MNEIHYYFPRMKNKNSTKKVIYDYIKYLTYEIKNYEQLKLKVI